MAPALLSRAASASSICPAHSACATRSSVTAGIPERSNSQRRSSYGLTERYRRRSAAQLDARRVRRLLSDGGDSRAAAAAAGQPDRPADHHRREVGRVRRGQDADRADALQRVPRQHLGVRRVHHRHAAEIEQELGTPVTFVPHLLPIDRGILETIYATLQLGRGRGGDRGGAARRLRGLAVRAADGRRSARDQARRAHELLRHRLAGETPRRGSSCSSSASTTS